MIAATTTNAQSKRADFALVLPTVERLLDVDAGRVRACPRGDAVCRKRGNHRLLQSRDETADTVAKPREIEQHIDHGLPRPVIGHLTTAVALHDRNIARRQQVLGLASLTLREHRRMLDEPELVRRVFITRCGEGAHRFEGFRVVAPTELTHQDRSHRRRIRRP